MVARYEKPSRTLAKAAWMGKRFLQLISVILIALIPNLAWAWGFGDPPPWGVSFHAMSKAVPGLVRTHDGLNRFERTRVARFRKDANFAGAKVRIDFSFKSNRLYQVEYRFIRPTREIMERLADKLAKRYGEPERRQDGDRPHGKLFKKRHFMDLIWETPQTRINLRWTENDVLRGTSVRSLFATFQEPAKAGERDAAPAIREDRESVGDGVDSVTLAFAGSLHIGPELALISRRQSRDPKDAYAYPLQEIAPLLKNARFGVAALDAPIPLKFKEKERLAWARGLKEAGLDLVTLTPRGMMKDGEAAMKDTLSILDRAGIVHVGAGRDLREARMGAIKTFGGVRFGFLAYANPEETERRLWRLYARKESAGLSGTPDGRDVLEARIRDDVLGLKKGTDHVIVLFSWGLAENPCVTDDQRRLAAAAFDAGATLVVGYHPGNWQELQAGDSKVVLYSPGALLPDAGTEKNRIPSLVLFATFTKSSLLGYDPIPVVTTLEGENPFQTNLGDDETKKSLMETFSGLSRTCRTPSDGK